MKKGGEERYQMEYRGREFEKCSDSGNASKWEPIKIANGLNKYGVFGLSQKVLDFGLGS